MPAGRPPNEKTRYTKRVIVWLHDEDFDQLEDQARLADTSRSEIMRRLLRRDAVIVSNVDRQMIKELRRIGGLLKHIHNQSDGVYSAQTAEALRAITAYIKSLPAAS